MSGPTKDNAATVGNGPEFHWSEGMKFAHEGIKSLMVISGAATISVLTFVGNTKAGDDRLVYSMVLFALAALLGPVSFLFAYLAQLQYGNGNSDLAWRYHKFTYGSVLVSVLLFLVGIAFAACAFVELGAEPAQR